MKLTDRIPYINKDGDVLEADRAMLLHKAVEDLHYLGVITDDEFSAIARHLHEQYIEALKLIPRERERG